MGARWAGEGPEAGDGEVRDLGFGDPLGGVSLSGPVGGVGLQSFPLGSRHLHMQLEGAARARGWRPVAPPPHRHPPPRQEMQALGGGGPYLKAGGMQDVGAEHGSTELEVRRMGKEERFALALTDA